MTLQMPREFYVPRGASKMTHKATGVVVYLYTDQRGKPCARGFSGQRAKPDFACYYMNEAQREAAVRRYFAAAQAIADRKATQKAEKAARRAKGHKLQVGHVLSASWGYDQTNIDFYQVVELVGKCSVRTRKIGAIDASKGNEPWATGKCVPALDRFIGEPELHRVSDYDGASVRIDDVRHAYLWDGRPENWTAYA